jgi:hypothetical protein
MSASNQPLLLDALIAIGDMSALAALSHATTVLLKVNKDALDKYKVGILSAVTQTVVVCITHVY